MKKKTSPTAYLIAESAVYLSDNPAIAQLQPPLVAELSRYFADSRPLLRKIGYLAKRKEFLRPFFDRLESYVIPGIQLHYLLRKRRIEELVRESIANGSEQIVVLGAGFDTLALRLHGQFPEVNFIEVDQISTQHKKRSAAEKIGLVQHNLSFISADLSTKSFAAQLLRNPSFTVGVRTVFVAEGLLMYLDESHVQDIFDFIRQHSAEGSKFLFTFMEKRADGRIAFRNSSRFVDVWLRLHREPFRWGVSPENLRTFLQERSFAFEGLDDTATFKERYLKSDFLRRLPLAEGEALCTGTVLKTTGILVNDIHSRLNETKVFQIVRPRTVEDVQRAVNRARISGATLSVSGGRHAMGGQQFITNGILLDMSGMNRVLGFSQEEELIEVESGIMWKDLIAHTVTTQCGKTHQVGIRQKQTGADRLSLGGALSANIHGRGLTMRPIIDDIECFRIVTADGSIRLCSREENPELFRLAIGGYGLFGVIVSVRLRLMKLRMVERVVEIESVENLSTLFRDRIETGFAFGDFQFAIDPASDDFIRRGVFSCYRPVSDDTPAPTIQRELSSNDWKNLLLLAHTDKTRAFDLYSSYYLSTNGQTYQSDTHQLSVYLDDYHSELDEQLGSAVSGSEMITEVYVPLNSLSSFLEKVREDFRRNNVNLIYGTIRLVRRDHESFLAWARRDFACIVFNLHVEHSSPGKEKAARDFRRLIDRAIEFDGSYYLTYHRWATRRQILACYPQMPSFLRMKRELDANGVFQSDWYRNLVQVFD